VNLAESDAEALPVPLALEPILMLRLGVPLTDRE